MAGLEPARLAPPPPQDGVSTSSTTSADDHHCTTLVMARTCHESSAPLAGAVPSGRCTAWPGLRLPGSPCLWLGGRRSIVPGSIPLGSTALGSTGNVPRPCSRPLALRISLLTLWRNHGRRRCRVIRVRFSGYLRCCRMSRCWLLRRIPFCDAAPMTTMHIQGVQSQ